MKDLLGLDVSLPGLEPIEISAKTGKGVDRVLKALVERTKPLKGCEKGGGINPDSTGERKDGDGVRDGKGFRALVIDSWFDQFRGVVALLSVADGAVRKGELSIAKGRQRGLWFLFGLTISLFDFRYII